MFFNKEAEKLIKTCRIMLVNGASEILPMIIRKVWGRDLQKTLRFGVASTVVLSATTKYVECMYVRVHKLAATRLAGFGGDNPYKIYRVLW